VAIDPPHTVSSTVTPTGEAAGGEPAAAAGPLIEIVVPVYNEQAALERSIRRLHAFLEASMPFAWRILIADNASTDATPAIARQLAAELHSTAVMILPAKGRGLALRAAWSASDAAVRCYMDVDLSTDLRALLPLVAGIVSGHSDVAIGTRLAAGARVVRGPKRELISRAYNRLLHVALGARFSDAQCGFKAVSADAARTLLPEIRDDAWFFDTELLTLAQRRGLRIHEVAVDWVDDSDSRVEILPTALADLRGVARLALGLAAVRFVLVGVASTLAYAALFVALRPALSAAWANALALALTAVANTQANRRFTFGLRGWQGLLGQHVAGAVVFVLALCLTDGALALLTSLVSHPPRLLEVSVLVIASALATVFRYVALRTWVFARRRPPLVGGPSPAAR
jgi:glycosyltransferase involved in cell wall biosynthesis